MAERTPITPDLQTLAKVLAPDSPQSTRVRNDPYVGGAGILLEAAGLHLPRDFFMTDFDRVVLNSLYGGATTSQVAARVTGEFAQRDIEVSIDNNLILHYLNVLRGKSEFRDRKSVAWSGNFPTIRARYNALRMMESGIFPGYKRDIQYITASLLSQDHPGLEAAKALSMKSTALVVDMMMLDLLETAPSKLTDAVEQCVKEYEDTYPNGAIFEDFMNDFKAGFVLRKPPATGRRFDRLINTAISSLWLEELEDNPNSFRAEDMRYVVQALKIFVRGGKQLLTSHRDISKGLVEDYFTDTYKRSSAGIGAAVINMVMGLDFNKNDVAEIVDRGFNHLQVL